MLRELADMSYIPAFHCGKDANGKLFGLFDLPRHVCEALAATVTDYRDALGDFATAIKNYLL